MGTLRSVVPRMGIRNLATQNVKPMITNVATRRTPVISPRRSFVAAWLMFCVMFVSFDMFTLLILGEYNAMLTQQFMTGLMAITMLGIGLVEMSVSMMVIFHR